MTLEQLKQALHKIDLLMHPQVLFINPLDYSEMILGIPDLEQKVKVIQTSYVESMHAILVNRSSLESYD